MLIFETDNIYVTINKYAISPSEIIFITFNNRGEIYSDKEMFWGDKFFAKNEMAAIGICAKSSNWFLAQDIIKALPGIEKVIQNRKVFTYGISMGGYGAIKFSKIFSAYKVIAFCPQWSINPQFCGDYERQYSPLYNDLLGGGDPITQSDINGDIFLFYDPRESSDKIHASNIKREVLNQGISNYEEIICPFTWHGPFFHLTIARSNATFSLISEIISKNENKKIKNNLRNIYIEKQEKKVHTIMI